MLLKTSHYLTSNVTLWNQSYEALITKHQLGEISDVDKCFEQAKTLSPQCVALHKKGYKSALLVTIPEGQKLIGVLELVSK